MIDLHTHSTASDGTYSPRELVQLAYKKGISVLALTDHDTTDGLIEAQNECKEAGIIFVPGIEISIEWATGEFHLLGLGLTHKNEELCRIIDFLKNERINRNKKMVEKLREQKIDITYEELCEKFHTKNIGRPHFAQVLQEKGIVKNRQQAFDRFFANGRPCFVDRTGADLKEAVAAIKKSGGLPVQAHPLSMYVSWGKMADTVSGIKESGVVGLEAWHPGARVSEAERLEELAHSLGMIATGGSDFHGEKVRADRKLGFASGKRKIRDKHWSEELLPALQKIQGEKLIPFE